MKKNVYFRNDQYNDRFVYRIQFITENMPSYVENGFSTNRIDILVPVYHKGHNNDYILTYYSRTYNFNDKNNLFVFTDFIPVTNSLVEYNPMIYSVTRPLAPTVFFKNKIEYNYTTIQNPSSITPITNHSQFIVNKSISLDSWEFDTETTLGTITTKIYHTSNFYNDIEGLPSIIPTISVDVNQNGIQLHDIYILTYAYQDNKVIVNFHKSNNLFKNTLGNEFYSKVFSTDSKPLKKNNSPSTFKVFNGWFLNNGVWYTDKTKINSNSVSPIVNNSTTANLLPLTENYYNNTQSTITTREYSCEKKIGLRFRCELPSLNIYFVNENTNNVSCDRVDVLIPTYKKDSSNTVSIVEYLRNIYGIENNKLISTGFSPVMGNDALIFNIAPIEFPTAQTFYSGENVIVRNMPTLRQTFTTANNTVSIMQFKEYPLDAGTNYAEYGNYPAIKITPSTLPNPIYVITYKYDYDKKVVFISWHDVTAYVKDSKSTFIVPTELYTFNGGSSFSNNLLATTYSNLLEGPPEYDKLKNATIEHQIRIGSNYYYNINPYYGTFKFNPPFYYENKKYLLPTGRYRSVNFVRTKDSININFTENVSSTNQLSVDRVDIFVPTYEKGITTANKVFYYVKTFGVNSSIGHIITEDIRQASSSSLYFDIKLKKQIYSNNKTQITFDKHIVNDFTKHIPTTKTIVNNFGDLIEIIYEHKRDNQYKINVSRISNHADNLIETIDPMFALTYAYDYLNNYMVVTYHPLDEYILLPKNKYEVASKVLPFNSDIIEECNKTITYTLYPTIKVLDGISSYQTNDFIGYINSVVTRASKTDADVTPLNGCSSYVDPTITD